MTVSRVGFDITSMNTNQLAVRQQATTLDTFDAAGFKGAVSDKGGLVGFRKFVAARLGIAVPKGAKQKEVRALFLTKTTKEELKALNKEYDSSRNLYWGQVNDINGRLAVDPTYRKTMLVRLDAKGNPAVDVKYRKISTPAMSAAAARIAELEAQLQAVLSGRAALPAAS